VKIEKINRKVAATRLLNHAVRYGYIERGPCEECGSIKNIEGHHENYDKALEVVWLCRMHHTRRHRRKGKNGSFTEDARIKLDLTQNKLAEILGTSQTIISAWENEKSQPSQRDVTVIESLLKEKYRGLD